MTKTWIETAENDLEFAEQILNNKQRPPYAAHFCHQAVEKILKAVVQQVSGQPPPRTHNLEKLLLLTGKNLPEPKLGALLDLAPHYLGTRYPADLARYYQQYSFDFVQNLYLSTKDLFIWIRENWLI